MVWKFNVMACVCLSTLSNYVEPPVVEPQNGTSLGRVRFDMGITGPHRNTVLPGRCLIGPTGKQAYGSDIFLPIPPIWETPQQRSARTQGPGLWSDKDRTLLPCEFPWIVDTIQTKGEGPDRFCADISTGRRYTPQHYYQVLPENRLFFFEEHVGEAIKIRFKLTH
jgi:hypothetical protein